MAWPNNISSSTPAPYQFKLISGAEVVICDTEPLEWISGTLNFERDLAVGGVFITYHSESLTFIGNGALLLRKLFQSQELGAVCTLYVYYWKTSTRAYVEFPSHFDINFNFYEIVKIGSFNFGVRVKAINSSTQTKLDSRKDIDIDITKLVSIGGITITEQPGAIKKNIHYEATDIFYSAMVSKNPDYSEFQHTPDVISYSSLPVNIISSQFTEVTAATYVTNKTNLTQVPSFFGPALYEYLFDIVYIITVVVTDRWSGSNPFTLQILETSESGGVTTIENSYDLGSFGNNETAIGFSDTVPVSVAEGNSLKLVVMNGGVDATYHAHSVAQYLTIIQRVAQSPAALTEGFPILDALTRVLQHILDVQSPLISTFLGSENQLRFAHIQSGMNQRGLALYNPSSPSLEAGGLMLNFKDLFKGIQTIWNVGYSIGESSVRIEEYAYFFQDVEVLDLSGRVSKYDIKSQVMPELVPNSLKSGFNNFEYLSANGRAEPNTTNERTSELNTATKFENVSPLRGDTKGILDNLSNPILENESKDTKGDSDIFIIKSQENVTYQWIAETGENISVDNGTSLFGDSLLNRYFTPTRMLIRQGNRIKSGMTKLVGGSVLRFQKSDKTSSLQTTGEGITVTESDSILISTLADPIFKPIKHTVECLFTSADLEVLQANPLGYITFGMSISGEVVAGFLLSLKKKNNEDKAEVTIVERFKTYVKPDVRTAPEAPVATAASDILSDTFTSNWLASSGATGYKIDVSRSSVFATFEAGYNNKDIPNVLESDITGLDSGTQYYYRVRAYNDIGISENSDTISIGTVAVLYSLVDLDGNTYMVVQIGTQLWIVENLKVTKYADGTSIPNLTDAGDWLADIDGAYAWHSNDIDNKALYGAIYNNYALTNAKGLVYFERGGIQETGWRPALKADYQTLIDTLLGITVAGGKLKEVGTGHWTTPNTGATDEVGFKGLPGGVRDTFDGAFTNLLLSAQFWTSDGWVFGLDYNVESCYLIDSNLWKNNGFSVRCVKDVPDVIFIELGSGLIRYRKGVRTETGRYFIDYSDDGGATWTLDLVSLEADEDTIIINIDGGVAGYRHLVRNDNYVIDLELTPLGFDGVELADWINVYTKSGG